MRIIFQLKKYDFQFLVERPIGHMLQSFESFFVVFKNIFSQ